MSPVKYELGFYIPEDDILHSHCCENLKSDILLRGLLMNLIEDYCRIWHGRVC
jgi:hypothetical protein